MNTNTNTTAPKWRLQLVRTLQITGVLAGFLGGADFLNLMVLLPPDTAAWLLVAGPAIAAGSRPLIELIGDLADDGIRNNSFKIPLALFLVGGLAFASLTGCAGLSLGINADGCALAKYTHDGQTYYAGPCIGPDGKVSSYVTRWTTPEGITVRVSQATGSKERIVEYQDAGGQWIRWSSKSGIILGDAPTIDM